MMSLLNPEYTKWVLVAVKSYTPTLEDFRLYKVVTNMLLQNIKWSPFSPLLLDKTIATHVKVNYAYAMGIEFKMWWVNKNGVIHTGSEVVHRLLGVCTIHDELWFN